MVYNFPGYGNSLHSSMCSKRRGENLTGQSIGQMKKINYSGWLAAIRNHNFSPSVQQRSLSNRTLLDNDTPNVFDVEQIKNREKNLCTRNLLIYSSVDLFFLN